MNNFFWTLLGGVVVVFSYTSRRFWLWSFMIGAAASAVWFVFSVVQLHVFSALGAVILTFVCLFVAGQLNIAQQLWDEHQKKKQAAEP